MDTKNFNELEEIINIKFKDLDFLKNALIHRSYLNEHHDFPMEHNERLEFLGDAVLELVTTEFLYNNYPNSEGELTNWRASLVNSKMLAKVARRLNFEKYLYLSKGEAKDKNEKARNYILANTTEAVIGAIYLDGGWDNAKQFIDEFILTELPDILENKLYIDPKSRFQEISQEKIGVTPTYEVHSESGPDHDKIFIIGVYIGEEMIAEGEGGSKQEAQVSAAGKAIKIKKWD
jgi:ribonuclease III